MKPIVALKILLPLLLALLATRPAAACGSSLEIGVRDVNDQPIAQVSFDIDVDGMQRTMATGADGLVQITCATSTSVRIVAARSATGQLLAMDENSTSGGLTIPITEGQIVHLPLRLSDTLLFVEPVAEGAQSAVFSGTPVASAPTPALLPAAGSNAPAAAVTLPIPSPSRPFWVWLVVALTLGVPVAVGGTLWLRSTAVRRRAR